jgi:ATP-dependent RNA helicase DDX49/DBP8
MTEQAKELGEKPHVVIATPGRLADHIESGTEFSLSKIQMLVKWFFDMFLFRFNWKITLEKNIFFKILDEADRLLEDNFGDQLQTIFNILPKKRQTLLFSATITDTIKKLQELSTNKPFIFDAQSEYFIFFLSFIKVR